MNTERENIIIIMAGGLGKRMKSKIPKVLHMINHKPMLAHVVEQSILLNPKKIFIVVGKYKNQIKMVLGQYISLDNAQIEFVNQEESMGTGHAIQCCRSRLLKYNNTNVVILSGDTPLLRHETILDVLTDFHLVKIVTTIMDNPYGYGRIIEKCDLFEKIVEEKDCLPEEKEIKKVNCGVYVFDSTVLCKYLPLLNNKNAQNEYYLTDVIELVKNGEKINIDLFTIPKEKQIEIMGVNTIDELEELETVHLLDLLTFQTPIFTTLKNKKM
jgi:UDP-N-acetylglucosamine diphosphorylase/glucosamine-1-phosphate N-acetyltransferase